MTGDKTCNKPVFGSLENFRKGSIEIIKGKPGALRDVERVRGREPCRAVREGRRRQESQVRDRDAARGRHRRRGSAASHDEFAVVLDGEIDVHFIKPSDGPLVDAQTEGSVRLEGEPAGQSMGFVRLRRGHQALLPAGAAYRFEAATTGVLLVQTILGRHSVEKWADICIQLIATAHTIKPSPGATSWTKTSNLLQNVTASDPDAVDRLSHVPARRLRIQPRRVLRHGQVAGEGRNPFAPDARRRLPARDDARRRVGFLLRLGQLRRSDRHAQSLRQGRHVCRRV